MSNLYLEIFDSKRLEVFSKLKNFKNYGVLGGGTAIALQIKHRKSFDFDIFLPGNIPNHLDTDMRKFFQDFRRYLLKQTKRIILLKMILR